MPDPSWVAPIALLSGCRRAQESSPLRRAITSCGFAAPIDRLSGPPLPFSLRCGFRTRCDYLKGIGAWAEGVRLTILTSRFVTRVGPVSAQHCFCKAVAHGRQTLAKLPGLTVYLTTTGPRRPMRRIPCRQGLRRLSNCCFRQPLLYLYAPEVRKGQPPPLTDDRDGYRRANWRSRLIVFLFGG